MSVKIKISTYSFQQGRTTIIHAESYRRNKRAQDLLNNDHTYFPTKCRRNFWAVRLLFQPLRIATVLTLFSSSLSFAQWGRDPNENLQVSPQGMQPQSCTDLRGGAYLLWHVNSYYTPQYLQRVDRDGYIMWTSPLALKGEMNGTYFRSDLSDDGFGGALVSFSEWEVSAGTTASSWPARVRLTRVDATGNFAWDSLGVRVCLKDTSQHLTQVIPDREEGGAFVTVGVTYGTSDSDTLYIQHISSVGERLWGDCGITVTEQINVNFDHALIPDGQGGTIIEWWTGPDSFEARFKRFGHYGEVLWSTESSTYYDLMVPDEHGGAVLAGRRSNGFARDIVVNRLSADGEFVWGKDGIVLEEGIDYRYAKVDAVVNDDASASFVWTKDQDDSSDIYTQTVHWDGRLEFSHGGIRVSDAPTAKLNAQILPSGSDHMFLWVDSRGGLFAQLVNPMGNPMWAEDLPVTLRNMNGLRIVSDGHGGAITTWDEAPLGGIFIQQINRNGQLGEPLGISADSPESRLPKKIFLYQNYPNPFNTFTTVKYSIPNSGLASFRIYSLSGELVLWTSLNHPESGLFEVSWDGITQQGSFAGSGVYLYEVRVGHLSEVQKMVLLR